MLLNKLVFHKKGKVIQNGDFNDIYRVVKEFSYEKIACMGPINYTDDIINGNNIYKQINLNNIYQRNKNTFFELTDKHNLQIIQLSIPDLFNIKPSKKLYLPIFKNVIIEKKDTDIIAIYFIVLNLINTKGKNGIIKLFS